jgi:hypothetical protein
MLVARAATVTAAAVAAAVAAVATSTAAAAAAAAAAVVIAVRRTVAGARDAGAARTVAVPVLAEALEGAAGETLARSDVAMKKKTNGRKKGEKTDETSVQESNVRTIITSI